MILSFSFKQNSYKNYLNSWCYTKSSIIYGILDVDFLREELTFVPAYSNGLQTNRFLLLKALIIFDPGYKISKFLYL